MNSGNFGKPVLRRCCGKSSRKGAKSFSHKLLISTILNSSLRLCASAPLREILVFATLAENRKTEGDNDVEPFTSRFSHRCRGRFRGGPAGLRSGECPSTGAVAVQCPAAFAISSGYRHVQHRGDVGPADLAAHLPRGRTEPSGIAHHASARR